MASSSFVDPPDELRACSEAFHAEAMKHLDAVFEEQSYSTCLSTIQSFIICFIPRFDSFIHRYVHVSISHRRPEGPVLCFVGRSTSHQYTSSTRASLATLLTPSRPSSNPPPGMVLLPQSRKRIRLVPGRSSHPNLCRPRFPQRTQRPTRPARLA